MGVKRKAVSCIIFVVATPMIAILLSLVLLAILNITNLVLILTTVSFVVVFGNLIISLFLYGKNGILKVFSLKNIIFYYILYVGVSIIICYAIFFVATVHGPKYEGDPFVESLAGGLVTILALNTILLRKFLIKNKNI